MQPSHRSLIERNEPITKSNQRIQIAGCKSCTLKQLKCLGVRAISIQSLLSLMSSAKISLYWFTCCIVADEFEALPDLTTLIRDLFTQITVHVYPVLPYRLYNDA